VSDAGLDQRLRDIARRIFVAMKGRGFGRLDLRSDPSAENIYFLEINPNCGLFYPEGSQGSADIILLLDKDNNHFSFIETLIACAIKQSENLKPKFDYFYHKNNGF